MGAWKILRTNGVDAVYNLNMPIKAGFTGNIVSILGMILVCHLGQLIAIIGHDGKIFMRFGDTPTYLIEYLIRQPSPEHTKWN